MKHSGLLTLLMLFCCSSVLRADESVQLDVCDVSFLWPLPETADDANQLIAINENLTQDGNGICSQALFERLIELAEDLELDDEGQKVGIDFLDDKLKDIGNWKIAGIRIDPSAPGCSSKIRVDDNFGSTAQIRLIAQPVLTSGQASKAHDFTIHFVFSYVRNTERPFEADEIQFRKIVDNLVEIKEKLKSANVETSGAKLGIHPGFETDSIHLTEMLREFLKSHLASSRLNAVAFMGIESGAEPWVFFATSKNAQSGEFELVSVHPSLNPSAGQALSFVTDNTVFPIPRNHQFGPLVGVSTSHLFQPGNTERKLFSDSTDSMLSTVKVKHIADIVANPELSHFFTTDCVSCHSESALRHTKLDGAFSEFAFKLPEGISAVNPDVLPKDVWNVRNFGWGFKSFGKMEPTVTMRTANEAAESAHFINEHYLSDSETNLAPEENEMVANALTLVMTCPTDEAFNQLKTKVEGLLGRDDNPINKALDEIGNVHFARFVFLNKSRQVMVITTYDGDFESYIVRFSEKIGDVFNLILAHVEDADSMKDEAGNVSVQDNIGEFLEFVKAHDLGAVQPFYSAYPDLSVQNIKQLKKMADEQE
ncbi:hypothetical protein ACYFX5_19910 [Bremerella sp. T1]|uniref:hypothetical protein n=1 Tax=Bremerella sp. TYQ1 TaxID=3119568 RepID=UPI001CCC9D6C|nr:hypothetical protein [Bremerella volcania]UBM35310.1 hypothetical protein LA756_21860 [Bremerella volcania]